MSSAVAYLYLRTFHVLVIDVLQLQWAYATVFVNYFMKWPKVLVAEDRTVETTAPYQWSKSLPAMEFRGFFFLIADPYHWSK